MGLMSDIIGKLMPRMWRNLEKSKPWTLCWHILKYVESLSFWAQSNEIWYILQYFTVGKTALYELVNLVLRSLWP